MNFGEIALLGDSVRKADVRAISPYSLLRISKDAMDVAHEHPEILERLEKAKDERSA